MIRTHFALLILCLLSLTKAGAETTNRLQFPTGGFSIQPLEPAPGTAGRQALIMALPPKDDFAANVNVMIQPYSGTLDEYITLSEGQFKDAHFDVIKKKKEGTSAIVFEYTGKMQGRTLHWYARAVRQSHQIYLVTATALDSKWTEDSIMLKACVDSFRTGDGRQ